MFWNVKWGQGVGVHGAASELKPLMEAGKRPAVGLLQMAGDLGPAELGRPADLVGLAAEPLTDTRAQREER
jgi:hypothetical protein